MKKLLLLLPLVIAFATAKAQTGYKNPILSGMYPDPSICRVGEDYYLINSSMGYYPGIPIWHSKDLVNWEQLGHVLTTDEQLPLFTGMNGISGGIMAPTIRYYKGTFYVISTNLSVMKNFIVTAKDPRGPWSNPMYINLQSFAIDPSLFFDDDGKVYLTVTPDFAKMEGIRMAEIDVSTGQLLSPLKSIWNGTGGWHPEGPHVFKKDGYYYLLMAEGGTENGHKVILGRSKNIDGPYESCPNNPILSHLGRAMQNSPIQGVGHPDIVQAHDGSWWMVVLGFRHKGNHHVTGRDTYLAPVEWTADGWPIINKTGTLAFDMKVKTLPLHPFTAPSPRDDFDGVKLGFQWNHINNPIPTNYTLTERPGYLRLIGNDSNTRGGKQITFVGRRQQDEKFVATAKLDFDPKNGNDEAGMTVFMDYQAHYNLSIKNIDGIRHIVLTYNLGSIRHLEKQIPLNEGAVTLKVESNGTHYSFSYSYDDKTFEKLGTMESKFLSTETNGGFTGVFVGLFSSGNGQKASSNADFDWFEYQSK